MKKQIAHSTRKHSDFSASATVRWMNCPGSVMLSKKAPPQKDSPYAREGTRGHECLEYVVKHTKVLSTGVSFTGNIELLVNKYGEEIVENAIKCSAIIYKLRPSPTAKLLIETRCTLKGIGPDMFGTLDYAWVDEWGQLIVIDYKYGAGNAVYPVDPETKEPNPQLMYYALGICQKYSFEFDSVKLAIIQPRVWKEDEDPLTEGVVTIKQVRAFEKKLKLAVQAAMTKDAPLVASESACRYCPAITLCPEVSKNQMTKADIVFDLDTGIEAVPDTALLTPATLPKVLDACDILETWIEKVRERAFDLAREGKKIEGRKLVQKRSTRQWTHDAEKKAVYQFGDSVYKKEFLSPAQLEKVIGGKAAKDFTERYTANVSTGVTLVSASDKRPEADITLFDIDEK